MDNKQIAYSLIPSWNFSSNNQNTNKIYINKKITNYKEYIFNSYNANNILNDIHEDMLTSEQINLICWLHDAGIQFHFKTSNSEIIIGGTSKFLFEKNLIQYETMVYSIGLGFMQQDILSGGILIIGGVFVSHLIPAYRLFKSWQTKSIDIINCEYM